MDDKYEHLYKNVMYIPPSVIRKMERETPGSIDAFGVPKLYGNRTLDSITGRSEFNRLLSRDLLNRDVYSDMKNKIMYSTSQNIIDHSSLNQL